MQLCLWMYFNRLRLQNPSFNYSNNNNKIKEELIEIQPIESPIVEVKVMYALDEVPNKVFAEYLSNYTAK